MIDLRLGDCLEIMKTIPDKSIDLVLTDPPFNVSLKYASIEDNLNDEDYYKWCKSWLIETYRILKDNHYHIVFTGDLKSYWIFKAIMECGLTFHHFLKWYKPTCQRGLSGTVLFGRTELAFLCSKNKPDIKLINRKKFYQDTLIVHNTTPKDKDATEHNARRPVGLYRLIINGFTQEQDCVLDCFAGGGTSGIACKELGRNFIGIEIEPKYYEIAKRRIENTTQDMFVGLEVKNEP